MDWTNALGNHELNIHLSDPNTRVCYACHKERPETFLFGHEWVMVSDREFGKSLWTKWREERIKVCNGFK
jgi:hypothetical protein